MKSIPLAHGKQHNYNEVDSHTGISFILPYKRNVRQLSFQISLMGENLQ